MRLDRPRAGSRAASRDARDLGGRFQQLAQPLPCPVQQHADGVNRDRQVPGDLAVTPFLQVMEAEGLGLLRRQGRQRGAERLGQLGVLDTLRRQGRRAGQGIPVGHRPVVAVPVSPAEPIHGAGRGQAAEQGTPVPHRLATRDLQRGQERLLEALVRVGAVAEEPVGRPPHRRPVPLDDLRPVRHASLRRVDRSTHQVAGGPGFLTAKSRRLHRDRRTS